VDKVSLEAAVNSANLNFSEASRKLDAVVAEIGELQGQMRTLREQLEHSQKSQAGVQVNLSCCVVAMHRYAVVDVLGHRSWFVYNRATCGERTSNQ
jgi:hypothetical protein